jgi:hypothetical protein
MLPLTWSTRLKKGIVLCWLSLLTLPVGLVALGGPCGGPRNIAGSLIILLAGSLSVTMPVYGVYRMFPSFRSEGTETRAFMAISALCACFVVAVGGFYLLFGIISLSSYLRYR